MHHHGDSVCTRQTLRKLCLPEPVQAACARVALEWALAHLLHIWACDPSIGILPRVPAPGLLPGVCERARRPIVAEAFGALNNLRTAAKLAAPRHDSPPPPIAHQAEASSA